MMRFFRFVVPCMALLAVLLLGACNLSPEVDALPTATPTTQVNTKPVVTILTPANGSEHRVNTELLVSANVRDTVGVTRVTMTANGTPVKNVASASPQGDLDKNVVLNYTPLVAGEVTLQVTAYRGEVASDPASITVRIGSTQPTATTGVVVTQGPVINPNDPTCRALINNPLNFRSGPGTNYPILATLTQGQIIPVTGRLGDNSWYQLNLGNFGWVSSQYVSLYGAYCVNVPIIAPPASPTPNVTNTSVPPTPLPPTLTPTITPTPGTPDLVITVFEGDEDVTIPSGQSSVNKEYQLTVWNIGTRRSGNFTVSLQLRPSGEIVKVNVANLRPDEGAAVVIDYTFDTPGSYILEAVVDADGQVSEISEANNKAQLSLIITKD